MAPELETVMDEARGTRMLHALGLAGEAHSPVDAVLSGSRAFGWANLSESETRVGEVVDAIRTAGVRIPRTGHIGNWTDCASARSGSLDYNFAVCEQLGVAAPLIFDLNQSEDADATAGDTIYLPGSVVESGVRTRLELMTWTDRGFRPVADRQPRFVPMLAVRREEQVVPLTRFHRDRIASIGGTPVDYQSDSLLRDRDALARLLLAALRGLRASSRRERLWETLADRTVTRDGIVRRRRMQVSDEGIVIGDRTLADDAVVEWLIRPLEIASDPDRWQSQFSELPDELPLLSNHAVYALLIALAPLCRLGATPSQTGAVDPRATNVHLQWGAIGLAGVPPIRESYFENNRKRVRSLFDLWRASPDVGLSGFFGVLPGPTFLLMPREDAPADVTAVSALCDAFAEAWTQRGASRGPDEACRAIVARLAGPPDRPAFSDYFTARFRHFRSPLHGCRIGASCGLVAPDAFLAMPSSAAAALVGLLWERFGASSGERTQR